MFHSTTSSSRFIVIKPRSACLAMVLGMLLISCDRGSGDASEVPVVAEETQTERCLDPDKVKADALCTMDYTPVCGCDGKTYSNSCVASNAGLSSWELGECDSAARKD